MIPQGQSGPQVHRGQWVQEGAHGKVMCELVEAVASAKVGSVKEP